MRSCIGLFEETGICRSGQTPKEPDLRRLIDGCLFGEIVSENLEEIGNFQRMLCDNFTTSWMERTSQMVRQRSGCDYDVSPGPIAGGPRENGVGEKSSQLVE